MTKVVPVKTVCLVTSQRNTSFARALNYSHKDSRNVSSQLKNKSQNLLHRELGLVEIVVTAMRKREREGEKERERPNSSLYRAVCEAEKARMFSFSGER